MQLELGLEFKAVEVPAETARTLQEMYKAGYRYVVQDEGMNTVCCFSLQPRKYQGGGFWGYADPDALGVLPAYPIASVELPGVVWSNKSATLIEIFLEDGEIS